MSKVDSRTRCSVQGVAKLKVVEFWTNRIYLYFLIDSTDQNLPCLCGPLEGFLHCSCAKDIAFNCLPFFVDI